jgi:hypothetical protein
LHSLTAVVADSCSESSCVDHGSASRDVPLVIRHRQPGIGCHCDG